VIFNCRDQALTITGYECVVIAESQTSIREALALLKTRFSNIIVIGDAKTPRNLQMAISEGEEVVDAL
jgi:hypothetical protein